MTSMSPDDLVICLRRVIAGSYAGKPLFTWNGPSSALKARLQADEGLQARSAWLDVNGLAEDVIPRRSREVLRAKVHARLQELIASRCQVLILENPFLLLRYEPSAPLGMFWSVFVSSTRAAILVLPQPVWRPHDLPQYVRFRGDTLQELLVDPTEQMHIVSPGGGAKQL